MYYEKKLKNKIIYNNYAIRQSSKLKKKGKHLGRFLVSLMFHFPNNNQLKKISREIIDMNK